MSKVKTYASHQEAVADAHRLSKMIQPSRRWQPLEKVSEPPNEHWANDIYLCSVFRDDVHKLSGPVGQAHWPLDKRPWVRIGISCHDGKPRHDWREFQRIKNELVGEEWEAIELYPRESRLLDPSNYYYLYCTPVPIPIGNEAPRLVLVPELSIAPQRGWIVEPPDAREGLKPALGTRLERGGA